MVRLRLVHENLFRRIWKPIRTLQGINNRWPTILSSLKSPLETGHPITFRPSYTPRGAVEKRTMRVPLTEGSGLTSRQVATRLGELGHEVEILSSTPLCLTRFTRHVRRLHLVPGFARSPGLTAAKAIAKAHCIDVLFPTQEQVTALSAFHRTLEVTTIVPDFGALRRVQDKISAFRTLNSLGIPQPHAVV